MPPSSHGLGPTITWAEPRICSPGWSMASTVGRMTPLIRSRALLMSFLPRGRSMPHDLGKSHVGGPGYNARMGTDRLVIHGAREHNLKNVTLDLPRGALIVFTGLSGSGKSSLAFDTIYAEGQRRYVESLS